MKNKGRIILIGIALFTALVAFLYSYIGRYVPMDQFVAIGHGENGRSLVAWYEEEKTVIGLLNTQGKIEKYYDFTTTSGDTMYTIQGLCMGTDKKVYVLRNQVNSYTGSILNQQLMKIGRAHV